MAKWSQRSYWKVVNGVRERFNLNLDEARAAYRAIADRLGRPAFGTDLAKHPRIVSQSVRAARLAVTAEEVAEPVETERALRESELRAEREFYGTEFGVPIDEYEEYDEYEITATTEGDTPRRK